MLGSTGKLLRVNLSKNKISEEKLPEKDARMYFGGRGLASNILFKELKPKIDPLGPENKLIISGGVLTATGIPGTTRYGAFGKSPLTEIWGEAHAAGWFAPELRKAGYIALIVEGVSDHPVYLWIHDGEAEIRDASHLWGKTTGETEDAIREELKVGGMRIACIGPGGERLIRYANIISDLNRAAGRCGMGAIMGSKRLKAIAARGTGKVEIADGKKLRALIKEVLPLFERHEFDTLLRNYGTAGVTMPLNLDGILPTLNFKSGVFDNAEKISGETMAETILVKRLSCPGCPVHCIRVVEVKKGAFAPVDPKYGGQEYETTAAFGSLLGIDDISFIARASMLCNMNTIDTISAGVSMAFAMECFEKGIITKEDLQGIDLKWGNTQAVLQLLEKIINKEGFGAILAEGVRRAAGKIGKGASKYAMEVKGLELPMHDPRGKTGVGLSYATSNRGACHMQGDHDPGFEAPNVIPEVGIVKPVSRFATDRAKVDLEVKLQNLWALYDSMVMCKFVATATGALPFGKLLEMTKAVTGWDITAEELMLIGERAYNLCRAFNVREGISRKDDILPERLQQPLPTGAARNRSISKEMLNGMLEDYYEVRGWTTNGIPTRRKLEELGLWFAAV